uniref:Casein kinase II subunit beta n=1 Tax=Helicotheca tamesis TaxID=374047 RepID=A0A7S2H9S8_9STRA|mmetsp:Transcript_16369/g.22448  ORF Transcript_16369/g.22448 Transcript_16369/m.22448 type:complete len:393 (+) Transcript_16369:265-1443(+)|eukprot:CAMPEP_0185738504 /NCGR_PEP_ID=MMETSP1171-20130828/33161_1 /TAXON_ID=374046 /ORGANISM="Helicotheca tamensis, Strain CCMP826" /LENGTH=392 /DNA_ID=CAMNT_0028409769 /DNA_START=242 /DNA_END=1420 /DNA_ORIENTATION=+
MAYNEDSSASGHDEPWIQWFCGLKGHEMFCEVERSYIEDGFNLYGLRACVSNFSDCLDLILDRIGPDDSDDSHLTQSACTLYGLIHARYIITAHGLDAMYNKYAAKEFGTCPLVQCSGQPVLPVGLKDEMGADSVKIFCPKCQSVYHPPPIRSRSSHHGPGNGGGGSGAVDGAAFGTTFPHLFLMTFNNLVPDRISADSAYVPRVFGFRVHQSARQRSGCGGAGSAAAFSSSTIPQANNSRRAIATQPAAPRAANTNARTNARGPQPGEGPAQHDQQDKAPINPAAVGLPNQLSLPQQDDKSKNVAMNASKGVNKKGAKGTNEDVVKVDGGPVVIDGNIKVLDGGGEKQETSHAKRKTKGPTAGDGTKNGGGSNENLTNKSKRQKRPSNGVT